MVDSGQASISNLSRNAKIGFIGAGRLGSSLSIAMARSGYRIVAMATRRESHQEWLRPQIPGVRVSSEAQDVVDLADVVFITVSDGAIRSVADQIKWRADQAVIHTSGAMPVDELVSATEYGSTTGGLHPMQTFPSPDAFNSFTGITFGIESGSNDLQGWLQTLATDLGGRPILISNEQRPAYHAAAVMACGLLAGLTGLAAEVWASSGEINRADAVRSLAPLVKTTANSIAEKGLPEALTGPYVRGDVTTVVRHIEASSAVSAEHGAAYAALALAALHLAREQGALTEQAESSIKAILNSALHSSCEKFEKA